MDILDIDSLLNDDYFCSTEEKIYDDVANIIKQWKINNGQNIVFDSRTFTRTKQKVATNLDPQFKNYMNNSSNKEKIQIDGPVTQRQQHCLLSKISPPNSKYCSLDTTNQMFNSLITSADFSSITFLCEDQLPTPTSNSKLRLPNNLSLVENVIEEIENTSCNPKCQPTVSDSLHESVVKDFKLTDHIDNIYYKENLLPNETFLVENKLFVENEIKSPESNKFGEKFNNLQIKNMNKSSRTPDNDIEQHNIFAHSTPQIGSGTSLVIHLSPISSKIKSNTKHTYENVKLRKTSAGTNSCENNIEKLLYGIQTNNQVLPLEKKSSTTNLFEDQYKFSQSASMDQSLDEIKKRFTSKIDKHAAQNSIVFKENSDFSPRTERLLNKRGTIYDNFFQDPQSICTTKNPFHEQKNVDVTKAIDVRDLSHSLICNVQQSSNNRDQHKNMKIIHKTNKELNNTNNIALETGHNCRFSLKNRNSPHQVVSNTDNIPAKKTFKGHLSSTYMSKTNSATELEHSGCPKDCTVLNNLDMKNNMGIKSKSFHNLSSNNYGYARTLSPLMDYSKMGFPNRVSSDDKLRELLEVRPTTSRRTGLLRPSTGIYSKVITNNKDVATYKSKTRKFEENPALTDIAATNSHVSSAEKKGLAKGCIKYQNEITRKPRLQEMRLKSNIKDSGLVRHSSIPKKE